MTPYKELTGEKREKFKKWLKQFQKENDRSPTIEEVYDEATKELQAQIDEKRKIQKFCEDMNDMEGSASAFTEIAELRKAQEACKYVPLPTATDKADGKALAVLGQMETQIVECLESIKKAETLKKEIESRFLQVMQDNNIKKWETDKLVVTRVLGGVQKKFDSKRFKEEQAEMYDKYVKDTTVSESIRFKTK